MPSPAEDRPPPARYTVSVRELCEFTAKTGSLDRRFTPSATATEGLQGQALVAQRRSADYETEVPLLARHGELQVRGRADGFEPAALRLEEVKTLRGLPEDLPENRRALHWAQLQTYGAMLAAQRGYEALTLRLVYIDIDTQTENPLEAAHSAEELQTLFEARCEAFMAWALQEAAHRQARDTALHELPWLRPAFRPGQRDLAEAVFRTAMAGRTLLAQAPTGIGKTLGTLYPLVRALPRAGLDKLVYVTCKGTGRGPALHALNDLCEAAPDAGLRVLSLSAKEQACEHPDRACHGEDCPLALGFYDRLPAARQAAVEAGWLDPAGLRAVALRHEVCPYYLGQELTRWADVILADAFHLFDGGGTVWGMTQALGWKVGVLVDEAHNLIDRTRDMYSAELSPTELQALQALAPKSLWRHFERVQAALHRVDQLISDPGLQGVLDQWPEPVQSALQTLSTHLGEWLRRHPLTSGALPLGHVALLHLARLAEDAGDHTLLTWERSVSLPPAAAAEPAAPDQASLLGEMALRDTPGRLTLHVRNVVPARYLRPRWAALHTSTLFSATLGQRDYQVQLLGLPDSTAWLDVAPPFPPEHLQVRVAHRVSTRYRHRQASLSRLVDTLARQFHEHPGNYLAFFSSHDYLQQAADHLAAVHPGVPQWRQDRQMDTAARQRFLDAFTEQGQGIGFAVLGGVFSEGVDLPGRRLIGAFVATLGLPPVGPIQDQIKLRLDQRFGAGCGYADRIPALQKVVQAAGRVLRTPEDRGWLWLLDDRYAQTEWAQALPAWWGLGDTARPPSNDNA